MLSTQTSTKSNKASSKLDASSDFLQDSLSAQTLDDDHLTTEKSKKPAPLITSLPGAKSADEGLAVADHREIEKRSQADKDDVAFQTMDADHSLGFTFQGTANHAERMKAKGGYTRGEKGLSEEQGEGYRVHVGKAGEKSNTKDKELRGKTKIKTVDDYQKMIVKDFNFGGVVEKFAGSGGNQMERYTAGKDKFVAAVVERFYPGMKVGSPETQVAESIALNIWSYACRGRDVTGGTDIGELQGLLYVFDKQIKKSSDSNTKMSKGEENTFIVPGTEGTEHEVRLQKGDDRHGRATILTTRHLLADMSTTPEDGLKGFDMSYMLFDKSSSMQLDEYKKLGQLMEMGGVDGQVSLSAFDGDDTTMAKVQGGKALTPKEASKALNTASAESSSKPAKYTNPALNQSSGKIMNEQGMANAYALAMSLPTKSSKERQLVIVTDEPDFNPGALVALQKVAKEKKLSVKVLYSFNKSTVEKDTPVFGGRADHYVILDLMKIKSADDFLIQRMDSTKLTASGGMDGTKKELTTQLDWGAAAKAQGAEEKEWQ